MDAVHVIYDAPAGLRVGEPGEGRGSRPVRVHHVGGASRYRGMHRAQLGRREAGVDGRGEDGRSQSARPAGEVALVRAHQGDVDAVPRQSERRSATCFSPPPVVRPAAATSRTRRRRPLTAATPNGRRPRGARRQAPWPCMRPRRGSRACAGRAGPADHARHTHPRACPPRRGAAVMDHLRRAHVADAPAGGPQALAEFHVFRVHEEVLAEQAPAERRAAHEQQAPDTTSTSRVERVPVVHEVAAEGAVRQPHVQVGDVAELTGHVGSRRPPSYWTRPSVPTNRGPRRRCQVQAPAPRADSRGRRAPSRHLS